MDNYNQQLDELIDTNRQLIKQQSSWPVFMRGMWSGIGAAVGGALIIGMVAWFLNQLAVFDWLRPAIQNLQPLLQRDQQNNLGGSQLPPATYSNDLSNPSVAPPSDQASPNLTPGVESGVE